jgi:hypothetical protein
VGILLVFRAREFILLVLVSFVAINILPSLAISLTVGETFESSLVLSVVSSMSFLFLFIVITRYYISATPENFWLKFTLIALASFSFYAILALVFGEPLLTAMGFEVTPLPLNSPLTRAEYSTLAFYTYGFSSITNGLLSVAVAYYLQKYMVRGLIYVFRRLTKYRNFLEVKTTRGKASFFIYVLWLVLLPFPIQNVLTPNPVGVSVLGTGLYLLATLALFAMLGLGLTALVGITKGKVFRLHSTFREALLWFLAIQWLSSLIYSFLNPPLLVGSLVATLLLLVRVLFAFAPPALISAYLYKEVLEKRAEKRILDYICQKEKLEMASIEVKANTLQPCVEPSKD